MKICSMTRRRLTRGLHHVRAHRRTILASLDAGSFHTMTRHVGWKFTFNLSTLCPECPPSGYPHFDAARDGPEIHLRRYLIVISNKVWQTHQVDIPSLSTGKSHFHSFWFPVVSIHDEILLSSSLVGCHTSPCTQFASAIVCRSLCTALTTVIFSLTCPSIGYAQVLPFVYSEN